MPLINVAEHLEAGRRETTSPVVPTHDGITYLARRGAYIVQGGGMSPFAGSDLLAVAHNFDSMLALKRPQIY